MRHLPNEFHASPRGNGTPASAADIERRLREQFRPVEQAREDGLRHDDDPEAHAINFRDRLLGARGDECALVRGGVLGVVAQNFDAADNLSIGVIPADTAAVTDHGKVGLERIAVESEKQADRSVGIWQKATTRFAGWCDVTGGRRRQSPFPSWAWTTFLLSLFGSLELVATAELTDSQAIAGGPSPLEIGFAFALASIIWGVGGACGTSIAADKRRAWRVRGTVIIVFAILLWVICAFFAAHLRASIESGATGNLDDILESIDRGWARPFASPVVLILLGTSAVTTAGAWAKWLWHIGAPWGSRGEHEELQFAEQQIDEAETAWKTRIREFVAGRFEELALLREKVLSPVRDGRRFEHEVALALAESRECFSAIDRATHAIGIDYATTFRRVRPGVDLRAVLALEPIEFEAFGDPDSVHKRVDALAMVANAVTEAVSRAEHELHHLEVEAIREAEKRYAATRYRRPPESRQNLMILRSSTEGAEL